jgi:hypothetical protein
VLSIAGRFIREKCQFGNNPHGLTDPFGQGMTNVLFVLIDVLENDFGIRQQKAEVNLGKSQIRTDQNPRNGNHGLSHQVFCLFLKNITQLFLNELGILLLSFAFHLKYLWYKFSEILGQALISTQSNLSHSATLLSFFKVNDPFRLIGVGIYLIVMAILMLGFFYFPMTEPRLLWMVLGERLSEGFFLYQDVVDDTGPISSGFFTLVHYLFGRSVFAYELIGRLLVLFQIVYWNMILIRYRVFEENTYLPAIIMAALFHFSFDMPALSPALLGSTFLILALGQLFSQTLLQKETSESTLLIGLYGGLATGFHLSYGIFFPYMIFVGIAISGFSFRQLILSIMGFFLPILLVLVFYYWNNGLTETLQIWPLIFTYEKYAYQPILSWLLLGAFPILLALIGYFYITVLRGSTVNQQKQRQLTIFWLIFSVLEFLLLKRQASFELVIFLPGLTYLITIFFLNLGKGILGKFAFFLLLIVMPAVGWWYWNEEAGKGSTYFIQSQPGTTIRPGEKIMVFSNDPAPFLEGKLGGPFLNYQLSKSLLEREKTLAEKAKIFQNLSNQRPQTILDPEGKFKLLLEELPALRSLYSESEPGIFRLK